MSQKLAKFHYQTVFTSKLFSQIFWCFVRRHVMTSWHLKINKLKFLRNNKNFQSEIKTFFLSQKCSFVDIQNKLSKIQRTQLLTPPNHVFFWNTNLLTNYGLPPPTITFIKYSRCMFFLLHCYFQFFLYLLLVKHT